MDPDSRNAEPDPRDTDQTSTEALFEELYAELRHIAGRLMKSERRDHTLQPTALVNEAYMRLARSHDLAVADRAHMLRLAATTMRRILVDHARERQSIKRGGGMTRVTLTDATREEKSGHVFNLVSLDVALEKLYKLSERQATIVDLRYFGGLTVEECAEQLSVSERTIKNDTRVAMTWLKRELSTP